MGRVLFLTTDLVFISRVQASATRLGKASQSFSDV
jgi:hypothetical protein